MTEYRLDEMKGAGEAIGVVDGDVLSMPIDSGECYVYPMVCCDCGLVHEVTFNASLGRLRIVMRRNDHLTAKKLHRVNGEDRPDGPHGSDFSSDDLLDNLP